MIDARARRDLISQWAFDSRPVLGRFHLWLEDVEERRVAGEPSQDLSFVGTSLEKCLILTAGVTALGTRLFGRWGEGKGLKLVPKVVHDRVELVLPLIERRMKGGRI